MPNDLIFLDTSGWIALLNTRDDLHQQAAIVWKQLAGQGAHIVVTDWVIAETGNGLANTPRRRAFTDAVRFALGRPSYRLVEIDRDWLGRAIDLYENRSDKAWGLVDCASFVVMKELGIREALTADHHFEQAGFRALLNGPGSTR